MQNQLQYFATVNESRIDLLRLDLPDPLSGGNKSFKMKYNLEEMRRQGKKQLLTFGGAFSNHIAAVAAAGKTNAIKTIGIIRGEELNTAANAVLRFAAACGMELHFISREEYRRRNDPEFLREISIRFDHPYLLPEGGSNEFAVKGCMEILPPEAKKADVVFCPVGTGATLAGIIASAETHQRVIGIAVLEGKEYLEAEVRKHLRGKEIRARWEINADFTFGGYAKTQPALLPFMEDQKPLPLDPVYSGKCFYALMQMVKGDDLHRKHLLFVHTGGYAFYNPH
jgi:1-aminocyclopropane-1-carboxylate deaminase